MRAGEAATLNLKPCKRNMKDRGKLEGTVHDARGQPVSACASERAGTRGDAFGAAPLCKHARGSERAAGG